MLSRTIMPPKTMACFSCILVMQRRRQVSILEESRMFCLLKKLHTFCYCCCCYCLPRAFHNNHWLRSFLVYQSPFFIQCLNCIIWKIYKQNTCKQYIGNRQNYNIALSYLRLKNTAKFANCSVSSLTHLCTLYNSYILDKSRNMGYKEENFTVVWRIQIYAQEYCKT